MNRRTLLSSTKLTSFTNGELRNMCKLLTEFCMDTIGYKKSKGVPNYRVFKIRDSKTMGRYDPETHTIKIFYNNIENLGDFVKTFIHEFTHSIQNLRYYANRLVKFGYTLHPDEIEARMSEEKYKRQSLNYIRKNFKQ